MKKITYNIFFVLLFLYSCEENEMIRCNSNDRINFMGDQAWSNNGYSPGTWTDLVDYYKYSVNFGINKSGENMLYDTLLIGVKITGHVTDYPRKVVLKLEENEEKTDDLKVIFLEEYYVVADTFRSAFRIVIQRPERRGVTHTANLIFDYANSDFMAGTEERQAIALTVKDSVSVELFHASNWENAEKYLGEYSNQKARFLITYYGCVSFEDWYTTTKGKKVATDLESYKAECEANPGLPKFLEEDGQWITFP